MSTHKTEIDLGILSFKLNEHFNDGQTDFVLDLVKQSQAANPIESHVGKSDLEAGVLLAGKYNELLLAVENKYENETRHETALRYIKNAETINDHKCSKNTCSK